MKLTDDDNRNPCMLELTSDRSLIDPKFNGYKLSLDQLPKQVSQLEKRVDKVGPEEEQYSLLHVKTFATHNFLISDPWSHNSVYFIDEDWNIVHHGIDPRNGRLTTAATVWTIPPSPYKQTKGRFNASLRFPHENLALVADGCGIMYLVETPARNESGEHWTVTEVFHSGLVDTLQPFVLMQGTHRKENTKDVIECVFARIHEKTQWTERLQELDLQELIKGQNAFINILEWWTLMKDGSNSWTLASRRRLGGRCGVDYCFVEPGASSIYIAGDSSYYFIEDSENPVVYPNKVVDDSHGHAEGQPTYLWAQDLDKNVFVWMSTPSNFVKEQCFVQLTETDLKILYKNEVVLEGQLPFGINVEQSKWIVEDEKVHIILQKLEGLMWSELIQGDKKGQELVDPEVVETVHERLGHLCTDQWETSDDPILAEGFDEQLEECDVSSATSAVFMRIERYLHRSTHQVDLCSNPYLLTVGHHANDVPSICLRSCHDGLVYKPSLQLQASSASVPAAPAWQLEHVATFSALGYIQASKTLRKFTVSPPDCSYAAICDSSKHIYLYRQPSETENGLRNRKTGENVTHISVQQVIAIDPPVEILGAHATEEYLFVLSASHLHVLRVKEAAEI